LKHQGFNPSLFTIEKRELNLSNEALVQIMQAVLLKGMPFRFQAKGISMAPFIKDKDIVTISSIKNDKPRFGDVTAFIRPESGKLILHRIIGARENAFLIAGDNEPDTNEQIPKKMVLGKLTKLERDGKRIYLGLGYERFIIALLSRTRLLSYFVFPIWRRIGTIMRRPTR